MSITWGEKEQHNKRAEESISAHALISILIAERAAIVRYFTACQTPVEESLSVKYVGWIFLLESCATPKKQKKASLSRVDFLIRPRGWDSCLFITLTLRFDRAFAARGRVASWARPAIINSIVTLGCLPEALWLRTRGGEGGLPLRHPPTQL